MRRRWKATILVTSCTAALIGGWVAWSVYHFFAYGIDNAYAQWGAGEMVVDYMKGHEGRWPKGWEDLRPAFEAGGGRVGGWSFEKYQSRIAIDWSADPSALEAASARSDGPPFDVIHPADGIDAKIGSNGANEILHRYLKARSSRR